MAKEHKKNLDLIRCIGTILIVVYHYNCTLMENGETDIWHAGFSWGGYSLGAIGVVIFFMLSGLVLTYNYGPREGYVFDWKKFIIKRLYKMFLLYWVLYFVTYIIYAVRAHNLLFYGGSPISILFSFFQLDFFDEIIYPKFGATYWLVGEWFSTVIIILYIFFPFLRYLYIHFSKLTTAVLFLIFVANNYVHFLTFGNGYFSITNGLFAFWLGMLFQKLEYTNKVRNIAFSIILLMLFLKITVIFNVEYFPVFIFSVAFFTVLYGFSFKSIIIDKISKISYEIYLLHHRVQIMIVPYLISESVYLSQKVLIFISIMACTYVLANYAHSINLKLIQAMDRHNVKRSKPK